MERFATYTFSIFLLTVMSASGHSQFAQSTWLGQTTSWSNSQNWSPLIPDQTTVAVFDVNAANTTVDVGTGSNVGVANAYSLKISNTTSVFQNGILKIAAGGGLGTIEYSSDTNLLFSSSLTIDYSSSGSFTIKDSLGGSLLRTLTINSPMINGSKLLTISSDSDVSINGIIGGGSGGITYGGGATLILSAANTFTGPATIASGALRLNNAQGLGAASSIIVKINGSLDLNGLAIGTQPMSISGSGDLQGPSGTGGYGIGNGALKNTSSTPASFGGPITLAGDAAIGCRGDITLDGVISGGFNLTVHGGKTLTLNGANNYLGATTVSDGTLKLGNSNALGAIAGGTFVGSTASSFAVLDLNGQNVGLEPLTLSGNSSTLSPGSLVNTSSSNASLAGNIFLNTATAIGGNGNITLSGVISGQYFLTKKGSGSLTLTGSNTFSGGMFVESGTLVLSSGDNRLSPTTSLSLGTTNGTSSGRLILADGNQQTFQRIASSLASNAIVSGSTNFSRVIIQSSVNSTYNGTFGGSGTNENNLNLTIRGGGMVSLGGVMNTKGSIDVEDGSLQITSNSALNSGIITLGNSNTSGLLILNFVSVTIPNVLQSGTGTGNAVISATSTNSYLTVPVVSSTDTTIFGTTIGSADSTQNSVQLIKTGQGVLVLNRPNTYSAGTIINGGTLSLANASGVATGTGTTTINSGARMSGNGIGGSITVKSGGTIAPGNGIGIINAAAGSVMTWNSGGIYSFEYSSGLISNSGEGTTHDFIGSLGTLSLQATASGKFNLNLIYLGSNQVVTGPVTIRIAQFTGANPAIDSSSFNVTGDFSTASVPVVGVDGSYVTLTFTPTPVPEPSLLILTAGFFGFAVCRYR